MAITVPLQNDEDGTVDLRGHYDSLARGVALGLWQRKWLIIGTLVLSLSLAIGVLVVVPSYYTAEAIISLNFLHEEPPSAGASNQPIASLDPAALVDSEVHIIRSRRITNAVVARLGLDRDPGFVRQPVLLRGIAAIRAAFGLEEKAPSPSDLAAIELSRHVHVTNQPRSYLISVSATSASPEQAARLANTVALEYLRSRAERELAEAQAVAAQALLDVSSIYGVHHPNYLRARAQLKQLRDRLGALQSGEAFGEVAKATTKSSVLLAEVVSTPAGPDAKLILSLAAIAGLAAGIGLARRVRHPNINAAPHLLTATLPARRR